MIRAFTLRNEYGRSYRLDIPNRGFFYEPEGLGYGMEASYMKIGFNWVRNYFKDAQAEITGSIVFTTDKPYLANAEFLQFIRTSSKLILVYETDAGEYLRNVDLISYEKSEISEGGVLQCPVTLRALGLWYLNADTRFSISAGAEDDTLKYSYKWPSRFQQTVGGSLVISNAGSVPAPFTVVFNGPIVNPKLILIVDDVEVSRVEITGEADTGETIKYSSIDGDLYCYQEDSEGIQTNLVPDFNINYDNFFRFPVGESILKVEADAQITQPIVVTMQKLFRAV